jgi:DNA-binding transcriptional ArsR family regulator
VSASFSAEGGGQAAAALLVVPESRHARRTLGTTAWAVLEEVALDAHRDDHGRLLAVTNVRRIARHLGISKDTAARALRRLAEAGLVERQSRRDESGTFSASVYVVCLDHCSGLSRSDGEQRPTTPCPVGGDTAEPVRPAVQDSTASPARPGRASSRRSSRRAVRAEQGGLFAVDVLGDHRR